MPTRPAAALRGASALACLLCVAATDASAFSVTSTPAPIGWQVAYDSAEIADRNLLPGEFVSDDESFSYTVPQFDPIFGTLTEVVMTLDTTITLDLTANNVAGGYIVFGGGAALSGPGGSETTDLGTGPLLLEGRTATSGTLVSGQPVVVPVRVNETRRRSTQVRFIGSELLGFTGSGTTTVGLQLDQSLAITAPPGEPVARIFDIVRSGLLYRGDGRVDGTLSLSYVFDPGVQTAETTEGLLAFSSAFALEEVLQRSDATVVPVPAALPLLAFGAAALGLAGRRR